MLEVRLFRLNVVPCGTERNGYKMKSKEIMEKIDFPAEAIDYLLTAENEYDSERIAAAAKDFCYENCTVNEAFDKIKAMNTGVSEYTEQLIFFINAANPLLERYKKAGIDEEIFWASMHDLKWKLEECHQVYGIWGTFVGVWFPDFYHLKRFALGRLQFERAKFKCEEYTGKEIHLKNGDAVYNVHIPSSGKLDMDSVVQSMKKAYEFYHETGNMAIVCSSWLLDPDIREAFPENSNIKKFGDCFDIIMKREDDTFKDAWRIFSKNYNGNPLELPKETTLQKNVAKWLEKGIKTGEGYGVTVFDGEKIHIR